MTAEFLVGRGPAFVERTRRLARMLDDRFDGFGQLLEDDALDHAASLLEAIEAAGCTLTFPDLPETPIEAVP